MELPSQVQDLVRAYNPATGCYEMPPGGSLYFKGHTNGVDGCHTEMEVLQAWYNLCRMIGARHIVETGVYHGLSTCILAAAIRDNGGGQLYGIDPWDIPHLWVGTELEQFITWIPDVSQQAVDRLPTDTLFDVAVVDSEHTYRTSCTEAILLEPRLREGGYFFFHDSLLHDGVGHTVETLQKSGRFEIITFETPRKLYSEACHAPVPMGMTVARKIRNGAPLEFDEAWRNRPEAMPEGPMPYLRHRAISTTHEPSAEQLHRQLMEKQARVDALLKSTSWRITSPLRSLSTALRRGR